MTGRLSGKVAVITGGGSGIGRASVLRFLEEGAKVIVAEINERSGEETVELARAKGFEHARFARTDVGEERDVEAAIGLAQGTFGRLDCVYNNAGVVGTFEPLTEISVKDWDSAMTILLRSVFLGLKHGARALIAQGQGGSLISTASISGLIGGIRNLPYSAAKAGVVQLTKRSATNLAAHRIRVNAIAPGQILTPMVHRGDPDGVRPFFQRSQPWPDPGEPIDIANMALYLASDESRFITGTTITVDGGVTAVGSDRFNTALEGFVPAPKS